MHITTHSNKTMNIKEYNELEDELREYLESTLWEVICKELKKYHIDTIEQMEEEHEKLQDTFKEDVVSSFLFRVGKDRPEVSYALALGVIVSHLKPWKDKSSEYFYSVLTTALGDELVELYRADEIRLRNWGFLSESMYFAPSNELSPEDEGSEYADVDWENGIQSLSSSLNLQLEQAQATIQKQQVRITELEALVTKDSSEGEEGQQEYIAKLEDEIENLRATQRKSKGGKQQRGVLKLKACQRIGAFAILLELITGKKVNLLRVGGGQNDRLKALYSEVTSTDEQTATSYICTLQDKLHEIKPEKDEQIRSEFRRLLKEMGISLGG